jgi:hypothetical protein
VLSSFVRRVFKSWCFLHKRPKHKALLKYTRANVIYYQHYLVFAFLNFRGNYGRVHFLDEASFESRDLRRSHGWGPAGEEIHVAADTRGVLLRSHSRSHLCYAADHTFTVTVMTCLDQPTGFIVSDPNPGRNDRWDFVEFVVDMLIAGHLRAGDTLVSLPCRCR